VRERETERERERGERGERENMYKKGSYFPFYNKPTPIKATLIPS
jgi:hypothetical protein